MESREWGLSPHLCYVNLVLLFMNSGVSLLMCLHVVYSGPQTARYTRPRRTTARLCGSDPQVAVVRRALGGSGSRRSTLLVAR